MGKRGPARTPVETLRLRGSRLANRRSREAVLARAQAKPAQPIEISIGRAEFGEIDVTGGSAGLAAEDFVRAAYAGFLAGVRAAAELGPDRARALDCDFEFRRDAGAWTFRVFDREGS